jgi:chromosomal replication initiator protein
LQAKPSQAFKERPRAEGFLIQSDREIMAALGQAIAQRIGEPRYNLWFKPYTKFNWQDDQLVVGVPNRFFQEWLQNKFADDVRAAAGMVVGQPLKLRFVIDPELFQASREAQAAVAAARGLESDDPEEATPPIRPSNPAAETGRLRAAKADRRWRRLSDFVTGPCNRVAHASAQSVVEAPGAETNPLVLYGPVGTGKTHLLEGIYAGIRKHHPDLRVCYATSEDFTNRFVQGMRLGKLGAFRKHFRECDVLLIDDLHFLATKPATQEEFLHTFDVLLANSKQLVLTCDCHPRLAEEFAAELTDRLLGGAAWSLQPPDRATRVDILRAKSARDEAILSEEVLDYLAEHLQGNVRELEGALQSVRHYSRVTGQPIDLRLAREAVSDLLRHAVRIVQLADVDRAVCRVLRLEPGALQSKQRTWVVSHPRMLAIYLARKHTSAAYSEIGQHFGGRNHSTAVAAERKVRQWLQKNGELMLGERRFRVRDLIDLVERELAK